MKSANEGQYELSENALTCLNSPEFYEKALKHNYDGESLSILICHFSDGNFELSKIIASNIL